jgi:hypothetical protein
MKVSFERTIYSSHPFLPQGPFLINHFGLPPIFGFGVKHTVVVSCCSSEVTMKLYTARTLRYHFGHILPHNTWGYNQQILMYSSINLLFCWYFLVSNG